MTLKKKIKELSDWKDNEEASRRQNNFRNRRQQDRIVYHGIPNNQYRGPMNQRSNNAGPGNNYNRPRSQSKHPNRGDNQRQPIQGNGVGPSSRATARQ